MTMLALARDDTRRRPTAGTWLNALRGAATAWGAPTNALKRRLAGRAAVAVDEDEDEVVDVVGATDTFAQALREDSNLEVDWLWFAARVAPAHERRYCLRRALRINPASEIARRALKRLPPA